MIRNAVIHILNEQPLTADLFALPVASDVGLVCTNLRTLDGRRPVFIDSSTATFFFPYLNIRFIEIPERSMLEATGSSTLPAARPGDDAGDRPPVPVGAAGDADPAGNGHEPDDAELVLDEDFLRKVREA